MKKLSGILAIVFISSLFCMSHAQTVSDVSAGQDGSDVIVTYTVDTPASNVQLYVSMDGGRTFKGPLRHVSGDVGRVEAGGRRIVWDVLSEQESLIGDDIVFEVRTAADPEFVDLGLSVKWATFNVGASRPEEYGDYYAWGETSTKLGYGWNTYKWCKGSYKKMTKYCRSRDYGTVDNKTVLESSDDVAHVKWGGSWRMPTADEWQELYDNCTWTWTTISGINGYKVTSKKTGYTDRWIFLPAAGIRRGARLYGVGSSGYYWSSSLGSSNSDSAYRCWFDSSIVDPRSNNNRYCGRSVRPVCD